MEKNKKVGSFKYAFFHPRKTQKRSSFQGIDRYVVFIIPHFSETFVEETYFCFN